MIVAAILKQLVTTVATKLPTAHRVVPAHPISGLPEIGSLRAHVG
jgi:hypothetical protein